MVVGNWLIKGCLLVAAALSLLCAWALCSCLTRDVCACSYSCAQLADVLQSLSALRVEPPPAWSSSMLLRLGSLLAADDQKVGKWTGLLLGACRPMISNRHDFGYKAKAAQHLL